LELDENTLKFYVERGRFRKRKEIAKEIPMPEIESAEKEANELSITSKGITSYFILEKATLAEELHTEITRVLKEQSTTSENAGEAKKEQEEPTEVIPTASTEAVVQDSGVKQETKDQTVAEETVAEEAGVESKPRQDQEKLAGTPSVSPESASPESIPSEPVATAVAKDFGMGTLEVVDNAVKFYVEKGRLNKRKEIVEEIPIAEIESTSMAGNRIGIVRSGITEMFTIKDAKSVTVTYEKIAKVSKEQQEIQANQEAAKLEQQQLITKLKGAIDVSNSLFDLLDGLHGRVDWDEMNNCAKNFEESVSSLLTQEVQIVNFDFAQLSSAVREHKSEEISKIAFNGLKSLYDYFSELSSKSQLLEQIHPNYQDARALIQSYYTLNDIVLGNIVGDQKIAEEIKEFLTMIENLSKQTGLTVNAEELREAASKLQAERVEDGSIEEFRSVFKQQLKNLIAP
jgi:hypothetical protein